MTAAQFPHMLRYILPILIVGIVLALRLHRIGRTRRLRLERLWVMPAVYGVLTAIVIGAHPPGVRGWLVIAGALLLGAGFGWQRGRAMHIAIDPDTHQLSQRASPMAILLLLALIVARMSLHAAAARAWHVDALTVADGLLAFALAMLAMTRLEMGLRARRLLAEARVGLPRQRGSPESRNDKPPD